MAFRSTDGSEAIIFNFKWRGSQDYIHMRACLYINIRNVTKQPLNFCAHENDANALGKVFACKIISCGLVSGVDLYSALTKMPTLTGGLMGYYFTPP
jgi:hypothetical protein